MLFDHFWVFNGSVHQPPRFALVTCAFLCIAVSRVCSSPNPGWGPEGDWYSYPIGILFLGFCFYQLALCLKHPPTITTLNQLVIH
jgi:hypothetical protein